MQSLGRLGALFDQRAVLGMRITHRAKIKTFGQTVLKPSFQQNTGSIRALNINSCRSSTPPPLRRAECGALPCSVRVCRKRLPQDLRPFSDQKGSAPYSPAFPRPALPLGRGPPGAGVFTVFPHRVDCANSRHTPGLLLL